MQRARAFLWMNLTMALALSALLALRARSHIGADAENLPDLFALLDDPKHSLAAREALWRVEPALVLEYLSRIESFESVARALVQLDALAQVGAAAAATDDAYLMSLVATVAPDSLDSRMLRAHPGTIEFKSAAATEAMALAMAATRDPGAADRIIELWRVSSPEMNAKSGATLNARFAVARALAALDDSRATSLLAPGLTQTGKRADERRVRHELERMTGACPGVEVADWQSYLSKHADASPTARQRAIHFCFAFETGTLVLVFAALISYITIGLIRTSRKWNSASGAIVLSTAIYAIARQFAVGTLATSSIQVIPYGSANVSWLIDTVILPYHVILFSMLAAFAAFDRDESNS